MKAFQSGKKLVGVKTVNQKVNETMLFIEDSLKEKIKKIEREGL